MSRKKKRRRSGTRKRSATRGAGSAALKEGALPGDLVPALVEAKLGMLRLTRALDAADVAPGDHPGLPEGLADCAQLDMFATPMLEFCDGAESFEDPELAEMVGTILAAVEGAIGRIFQLLPTGARKRVRKALGQVGASEPEVWLEVEALRAEPVMEDADVEPTLEKLTALHDEAVRAFQSGDFDEPSDEEVTEQEAKTLPDADEPGAWLETLPEGWLRTVARMHGVPSEGPKAKLVGRVADALLDRDRLAAVLAKGLGGRERMRLAEHVAVESYPLEELPDEVSEDLWVPWDWAPRLPPSIGGKLRAFGLLYVGMQEGMPTVAVPPDLLGPIAYALRTRDRKEWKSWDADIHEALTIHEALAYGEDELSLWGVVGEPRLRRAHRSSGPQTKPPGPERVYVLDVDLRGSEPPVSRQIRVSGRRSLGELHRILQDMMGWGDEHLHAFEAADGSWRYADVRHEVAGAHDEDHVSIDQVARRVGSRFVYEYDFGDGWIHDIRVAERLDPKGTGAEPWCLGGRNACPPEDSGGVMGYAWKLEVLGDPDHIDHADIKEWMEGGIDPTRFDPMDVNRYYQPGNRA